MRWIAFFLLTIGLLACAACSTTGSVNGRASEHGGYGRAAVGLPF